MTKWMSVLAVTALLAIGCNENKKDADDMNNEPKKMSTDSACNHCTGSQTATATPSAKTKS